MSSNLGAVTRTEIFSHIMPNKWRTINPWVHQFDFTIDEGNGRLHPSRYKTLMQAPQKEGGEEIK